MSSLGGEPDGYKAQRSLGDAFDIWYWRDGGLGVINWVIVALLVAAVIVAVVR